MALALALAAPIIWLRCTKFAWPEFANWPLMATFACIRSCRFAVSSSTLRCVSLNSRTAVSSFRLSVVPSRNSLASSTSSVRDRPEWVTRIPLDRRLAFADASSPRTARGGGRQNGAGENKEGRVSAHRKVLRNCPRPAFTTIQLGRRVSSGGAKRTNLRLRLEGAQTPHSSCPGDSVSGRILPLRSGSRGRACAWCRRLPPGAR